MEPADIYLIASWKWIFVCSLLKLMLKVSSLSGIVALKKGLFIHFHAVIEKKNQIICSAQCIYANSDGAIHIAFKFRLVSLEATKEHTVPEPVPRGVRLEKLLTARLWPRCLRLHAVRHLESMLCLMRYQSDSEMPNLWNKWPVSRQQHISIKLSQAFMVESKMTIMPFLLVIFCT